jgi:hypothetical protein
MHDGRAHCWRQLRVGKAARRGSTTVVVVEAAIYAGEQLVHGDNESVYSLYRIIVVILAFWEVNFIKL